MLCCIIGCFLTTYILWDFQHDAFHNEQQEFYNEKDTDTEFHSEDDLSAFFNSKYKGKSQPNYQVVRVLK